MYFEQFYLNSLSHASYLLGSDGVAVVIDPQRDVDLYLQAAAAQNLKIAHIIETAVHADFISGHAELAARTGAQIYISSRANATFPHTGVGEGFELKFGACRLRVIETPGHSPESICLEVYDPERGSAPWAVLTGATLLSGDVGRTDLCPPHSAENLAALLYHSIHQRLLPLPDATLVYPGRGVFSSMGWLIRRDRSSSIGIEKQTNPALQLSRDEFIAQISTRALPRPQYFSELPAINRAGAPPLASLPQPPALSPQQAYELQQQGAFLLDTGPAQDYVAGHVAGSVCIDLRGDFEFFAAATIGPHTPVVLISVSDEKAQEARMRLARVGVEDVRGFYTAGIDAWEDAGLASDELQQIGAAKLHEWLEAGKVQVLDVRRPAEWHAGHIAQASLHTLEEFPAKLPRIREGRPVALHCAGGFRSLIACGLLKRTGINNIINTAGGIDAWNAAKLPLSRE